MRTIKQILVGALKGWYEPCHDECDEFPDELEEYDRAMAWVGENLEYMENVPRPPMTEFEKRLNGEMYKEYLDTGETVNRKYYITVDDDIELEDVNCPAVHVFNGDYGKYILEVVK